VSSTPVPTSAANVRASLDVLREQIAPEASDRELTYLAQVARRYDLDAIAGQVVLIPRWDKRLRTKVHRPIVTVEGRHVIAERSGELHGVEGPEWCGPRHPDGSHTWLDVWDYDEPPHAARVYVHRTGRLPMNGTVTWAEFAQRDGSGNLLPTWKQMPSHMLGKTALSLGLRRAFPGLIPGDLDVELEREFADSSVGAEVARDTAIDVESGESAPPPASSHAPHADELEAGAPLTAQERLEQIRRERDEAAR
jgi:phage recombination protein Bet